MKQFSDLKFRVSSVRENFNIIRAEEYFDNGYGASVIKYGDAYEMGILEHTNGESKSVKLSNMFDGPLIPCLTEEGVTKKLIEIQEYLNHGTINRENENRSKRAIEQSGDEITSYSF